MQSLYFLKPPRRRPVASPPPRQAVIIGAEIVVPIEGALPHGHSVADCHRTNSRSSLCCSGHTSSYADGRLGLMSSPSSPSEFANWHTAVATDHSPAFHASHQAPSLLVATLSNNTGK